MKNKFIYFCNYLDDNYSNGGNINPTSSKMGRIMSDTINQFIILIFSNICSLLFFSDKSNILNDFFNKS